jgi:hypothetical protein
MCCSIIGDRVPVIVLRGAPVEQRGWSDERSGNEKAPPERKGSRV